MNDEEIIFTDRDEELLRQAMRFLKYRELLKEPFEGYWEDEDDI